MKLCEIRRNALDSLRLIYNGVKLISSEEEKNMLLKNEMSTDTFFSYRFNDHKRIELFCDKDRSINMIGLINESNYEVHTFEPKGLWYVENITSCNGYLDTTSLLLLVEQEEKGYLRA